MNIVEATHIWLLIMSEQSEQSSYSNSSKTFEKNQKKLEYIFITILELAIWIIYMMNGPSLTRPGPTVTLFDGLFLTWSSIKYSDVKFRQNLHQSLQLVLSKYGINIFDSLETMRFTGT